MKGSRKAAVVASGFFLASAYASGVNAGTGICLTEAAFSQVWELKTISCSGPDCLIEMDRVSFFSIPSAGAARLDAGLWRFTWTGNFGGATQGTLQYSCDVTPNGPLPYTGPGMAQRNANFTAGVAEHIVGRCSLNRCPTSAGAGVDGEDKATQP